jgi:hypothetical protein
VDSAIVSLIGKPGGVVLADLKGGQDDEDDGAGVVDETAAFNTAFRSHASDDATNSATSKSVRIPKERFNTFPP